ncbi:ADP-ribosylglycohydrolase family protein [bacterium]|nr:ADP-ribosylglycohydrolase family protein [bacterium]
MKTFSASRILTLGIALLVAGSDASAISQQRARNILNALAYGDSLGGQTEFGLQTLDQYKTYIKQHGKNKSALPFQAVTQLSDFSYNWEKSYTKIGTPEPGKNWHHTTNCSSEYTFPREEGIHSYTDDTVMSEFLGNALLAAKDKKSDHAQTMQTVGSFFKKWYDQEQISPENGGTRRSRCNGAACEAACTKLNLDGSNWDKVGTKTGGCGSVMRLAPIAMLYNDDPEKARDLAIDQSRITHTDPGAVAACAALTKLHCELYQKAEADQKVEKAVEAAIKEAGREVPNNNPSPKQIKGFVSGNYTHSKKSITTQEMLATAQQYAKETVEAVSKTNNPQDAFKALDQHHWNAFGENCIKAPNFNAEHYVVNGKSGQRFLGWGGVESVCGGVYQALVYSNKTVQTKLKMNKKDCLRMAVQTAANTVGDSDSLAAITGSIVGALSDECIVPQAELKTLENTYDNGPLHKLAQALSGNKPSTSGKPVGSKKQTGKITPIDERMKILYEKKPSYPSMLKHMNSEAGEDDEDAENKWIQGIVESWSESYFQDMVKSHKKKNGFEERMTAPLTKEEEEEEQTQRKNQASEAIKEKQPKEKEGLTSGTKFAIAGGLNTAAVLAELLVNMHMFKKADKELSNADAFAKYFKNLGRVVSKGEISNLKRHSILLLSILGWSGFGIYELVKNKPAAA